MPSSVKRVLYIKCYSLSSARGFEHSSNSIRNKCKKLLAVEQEVKQKFLKIKYGKHFQKLNFRMRLMV